MTATISSRRRNIRILTMLTAGVVTGSMLTACGSDVPSDVSDTTRPTQTSVAQSDDSPVEDNSATWKGYSVAAETDVESAGDIRGLESIGDGEFVATVVTDMSSGALSVVRISADGDTEEIASLPGFKEGTYNRNWYEQDQRRTEGATLTRITGEDGQPTDDFLVVQGGGLKIHRVSLDGDVSEISRDRTNGVLLDITGVCARNGTVTATADGYNIRNFTVEGDTLSSGNGYRGLVTAGIGETATFLNAGVSAERMPVLGIGETDCIDDDVMAVIRTPMTADAVASFESEYLQHGSGGVSPVGNFSGDAKNASMVRFDPDNGNVSEVFTVDGISGEHEVTTVAVDSDDKNAAWVTVKGQDTLYKLELQ